MESFAAKVRYGLAPHFDLMLEEKGGWISREAPRQEDVVITGLAEASKHAVDGGLNPFTGHIGEILPPNLERHFSSFLVRNHAIKFKVNTQMLLAHIEDA